MKNNFKELLQYLGFSEDNNIFSKNFSENSYLKVDFQKQEIIYPEDQGLKVNERQTCNFSSAENIVVLECVHRLLAKGYKPEHIELEPKWKLGHGASGGRADILVKDQEEKPLLLIECKTYGKEFNKEWEETCQNGGQLFSYAQQISAVEYLCLYASSFDIKTKEITVTHKIIAHKDNQKILENTQKETQMKSFQEAKNVEQRFEVWKNTYQLEFTTKGIFEEDIQTYQIGKEKYTLEHDTKETSNTDKDGKYHQFATILRKHNIARKETAFEVLVNLFLCKIVDEENNSTNLKNDSIGLQFYWKGIAYDDYYEFIDRLQALYQQGMRKLLHEEIIYVSNEDIRDAFWTVKNNRNATKKKIEEHFRKLKFYSNNAFSLIDVHNEQKFNRNTKILVELVQMWQDLRLKTDSQNQFLGDMFEFFLDNSIKQSEGQYFTPIPITKFIVGCLPLKDKISNKEEPLNAIDFACGSGHFLTEYAHQIEPMVKDLFPSNDLLEVKNRLKQYYGQTIGIEKEDRLAKIAKVSVQMYGQGEIDILEQDALMVSDKIKEQSFDILVANPPFSVKGFLQNLDERQKDNYQLSSTADSDSNNIQCFFIERAQQLMAASGVVGLILPSSVLSNNDSTTVGAREIILKYFNIVALVELGSGTFGKTGTNTVVLFLERKSQNPEPSEHYDNRVNDFFNSNCLQDTDSQTNFEQYQDLYFIEQYCQHVGLPLAEYKKLFGITKENYTKLAKLLEQNIFVEYHKAFNGGSELKSLKSKKWYKDLADETKQQAEENEIFIKHLHKIEKEKLFYFMLAYSNKHKVLIIKSPSEAKKQKQFLGYEWSGSKGNEGIKYNGGDNIYDIITPLFNPNDFEDPSKINTLIRQNFLKQDPNNLENFAEYTDQIHYVDTTDLLDFGRIDFTKSFSLNATKQQNIAIKTKWPLVKLGEIYLEEKGLKVKAGLGNYLEIGDININTKQYDINNKSKLTVEGAIKVPKDTILISTVRPSRGAITITTSEVNVSNAFFKMKQNNKYLYHILNQDIFFNYLGSVAKGGQYPTCKKNDILNFKIPLPPPEIQTEIVNECEAIDQESQSAQQTITQAKAEIESKVKAVIDAGHAEKKLGEIAEIVIGGTPSRKVSKYFQGSNLWVSIAEMNGQIITDTKEKITEEAIEKSNVKLIPKGTTLLSFKLSIGKTAIAGQDLYTNEAIAGLIPKDNDTISNQYLYHLFSANNVIDLNNIGKKAFGQSLNSKFLKEELTIPVPPLEEQNQLIAQVELLENKITRAQQTIEQAPQQKQMVLEKHLQ